MLGGSVRTTRRAKASRKLFFYRLLPKLEIFFSLPSHVFSSSFCLFSRFSSFLTSSSLVYPLLFHHHYLTKTLHLNRPNFSSILHSCPNKPTLKKIHAIVISTGIVNDPIFSLLIASYASFGDLETAVAVFDSLSIPSNAIVWNSLLKAHVDTGMFDSVLALYFRLREVGVRPDSFTFPLVNRAISALGNCLENGEKVHSLAIQMGFGSDVYFCNTLIEMYGKCGRFESASMLFDEMPLRDVVSWTSMICAYIRIGEFVDSFTLFGEMQLDGVEPNSVTIETMLQSCTVAKNAAHGRKFHGYAIKKGFETYELVKNSILKMYIQICSFEDGENMFDKIEKKDVVTWNIIISGYSSKGDLMKLTECFYNMRLELIPSLETLTMIISSFAKAGKLLQGQRIHGYGIKSGLYDALLQTSLLDFYAKCGEMAASGQLFEDLKEKNCVSWSVMTSGFIQNGYFKEAIELFHKMQITDFRYSIDILRSIILAYSHLGVLRLGKGAHGCMIRNGLCGNTDETKMETAILNLYSKCGSIAYARTCFDQMAVKDVVAWSSMIEGYGIHGLGLEALELFEQMQEEGVQPNSVTFLSLLSACSHSGLVNEGCEIFSYMSQEFRIKPEINHYTCLVDLLGRSGRLQEALRIIETMTVKPDSRIWGALLAASRTYSDSELGIYAGRALLDLEPENAGYHVVLSNVHVRDERWSEAENLRGTMIEKDLRKRPGWSCIETGGELHGFVAGDRSHPRASEIHQTVVSLTRNLQAG